MNRSISRSLAVLTIVLVGLALSAAFVSCVDGSGDFGLSAAQLAVRANARCMECHIDFEEEEIVAVHGRHGVSCVRCHGPSRAHMADEVRKTKADATFRGPAMAVFCLTCHKPGRHGRVKAHAAERAKPLAKRRSCTACHGEHKLLEIDPTSRPAKTATRPAGP